MATSPRCFSPGIAPRSPADPPRLLEEIGRLWYRGKDLADPEQQQLEHTRKVILSNWAPGNLVAWDELVRAVRKDQYSIGQHVHQAQELYPRYLERMKRWQAHMKQLGRWIEMPEAFRHTHKVDADYTHDRMGLVTPVPRQRAADKVGRNDPCPCGSGQKFKKCCAVGPVPGKRMLPG